MSRRYVTAVLSGVLCLACLTGCESSQPTLSTAQLESSHSDETKAPSKTTAAVGEPESPPKQKITFGVVPQQAPSTILRNWQPFADEMSKQTGMQWIVKTAPSIPEFEKRCLEGRYQVAYMNPYHYTVFAQKPGYEAFARQKDKKIKGILVVAKDGPIKTVDDLAGKKATFPSPAAFAASVITRNFLDGRKIKTEINYANSHDSVYQNVAAGIQDVGGGVMRTWNANPEKVRDKLKILWTSPTYTPHAFAMHPKLDESTKAAIIKATKSLENAPRNPSVYDPIRFKGLVSAADSDWNDVRALGIQELASMLKTK